MTRKNAPTIAFTYSISFVAYLSGSSKIAIGMSRTLHTTRRHAIATPDVGYHTAGSYYDRAGIYRYERHFISRAVSPIFNSMLAIIIMTLEIMSDEGVISA